MDRLEEIDQQLAALGTPASDMQAALERVLGKERSLASLDELLSGLGEVPVGMLRPRMPSSLPPRRSLLPQRIATPLASLASPSPLPSAVPSPSPSSSSSSAIAAPSAWPARPTPSPVRSSAPSSSPSPSLTPSSMPVIGAIPPLPRITDTLVDSPFVSLPPVESTEEDLDTETAALLGDAAMPSAVPLPFGPSVEMSATSVEVETRVGPPPEEIEAAAQEQALERHQALEQERERRDNVRALLDQEIDPNDFPSERPPKARDDDGDGVEMLLEDDEILEIEDDELLEDDEPS